MNKTPKASLQERAKFVALTRSRKFTPSESEKERPSLNGQKQWRLTEKSPHKDLFPYDKVPWVWAPLGWMNTSEGCAVGLKLVLLYGVPHCMEILRLVSDLVWLTCSVATLSFHGCLFKVASATVTVKSFICAHQLCSCGFQHIPQEQLVTSCYVNHSELVCWPPQTHQSVGSVQTTGF